ncbi:hypothetical protein ACC697_39615, partial [Rhizobium ruizarguesonis]
LASILARTEFRSGASVDCMLSTAKAGKRIAEVFQKWKNWKLVADGAEVAPGVQLVAAHGHTPGHSTYLVASGSKQLLVS